MSDKKRTSGRIHGIIPAGAMGVFGIASAAMGQTYIGATATNGWNASSDVLATASSWHDSPGAANVFGPTNLVNGGGLDPSGTNSCANFPYNANSGGESFWDAGPVSAVTSPSGLAGSAWAEFTFTQSYNLGAIDIWNGNQVNTGPYNYQDLQDCTIQVSNDGSHWTTVFTGAVPEVTSTKAETVNANAYQVAPVSLSVNTNSMAAQYVLITAATSNFNYDTNGAGVIGGSDAYLSLDAVEFQTSAFVPPPPPPGPTWSVNGSGNWSTASNWADNAVPNGVGAEAEFIGVITSAQTVYTNAPITEGTLVFNSANTFVLTGAGSLTMQSSSGPAQITVQNGTQELDFPVTIASNTTLDVSPNSTLLIANPITINSGSTLTATGGGTVTYQSLVTVQSGASIAFANSTHANTLNVASGGTASITGGGSVVEVDNLNDAGTLDVGQNELIVNYGNAFTTPGSDPMSSIRSLLIAGYNNGSWNGTGIISTAAQTPTHGLKYGIGWADGADGTKAVAGLASGQIELKYTLLGDANLDGSVNGTDFSILAANFGLGVTNWDQGNFLYGSSVNGSDFSALAANFGQGDSIGSAATAADWAALDAFAAANGLTIPAPASVPEPATLGLLAIGTVGMLRRRRRN